MIQTIEDLQAYIEGRFPSVRGFPSARCPTDDLYVVLGTFRATGAGILPEGMERIGFTTPKEALSEAKKAFDFYADGKTGTLYWRMQPRIDEFRGLHRVYLRLVITDNPVLWASLKEREIEEPREPLYIQKTRRQRQREPRLQGDSSPGN